jgi:hypothetical protein
MIKSNTRLHFDESALFLVLSNIATITLAVYEKWRWSEVMWIYWGQSIIIGYFSWKRIRCLKNFSTDGFTVQGRDAQPTKATQRDATRDFAWVYGSFHAVYGVFLCIVSAIEATLSRNDVVGILSCIILFACNHRFSFHRNVESDLRQRSNIAFLMFFPLARILPIHLTVAVGFQFRNRTSGILLFFLCLKTIVDLFMHLIEHRKDRQHPAGDAETRASEE